MEKKTYNQPSVTILAMQAENVLVTVSQWDGGDGPQPIKPGNPDGGPDAKENTGGNLWSDDDQDWD